MDRGCESTYDTDEFQDNGKGKRIVRAYVKAELMKLELNDDVKRKLRELRDSISDTDSTLGV
jgi:hypothetical protein